MYRYKYRCHDSNPKNRGDSHFQRKLMARIVYRLDYYLCKITSVSEAILIMIIIIGAPHATLLAEG